MKEIILIIIFVTIIFYLRSSVFRRIKAWEDWCDINFPFMSDEEVRDYLTNRTTREFNINDNVKVKLKLLGKNILKDNNIRLLGDDFKTPYKFKIEVDDGGYYNVPLWKLMNDFGPHMLMGNDIPFETNIKIEVSK